MDKTDKVLLAFSGAILVMVGVVGYVFLTNPGAFMGSGRSSSMATSKLERQASKPTSVVVTYDEVDGFEPKSTTVDVGQTVLFKNDRSSQPMYVASDPHPEHTDYPEFETMAALKGGYPKIGDDLEFTFERKGTWMYHDHADPEMTGIIIVE